MSANDGILVLPCSATDLAAGKCLGRARVLVADQNNLQKSTAAGKDTVLVHTGVV